VLVLPLVVADGATQMARDEELLGTAAATTARRYLWDPPAVSLGKFQSVDVPADLCVDVVRRPTGGRAVLHGAGFEWSFSVALPLAELGSESLQASYRFVTTAMRRALEGEGARLDDTREVPYVRSGLCFATALRHDLLAGGEKVVAVAQARRGRTVLVHGSVLERRPPGELVAAVERLVGEPWRGEGLAASGLALDADAVWSRFTAHLAGALGATVETAMEVAR
jgi:lipoate-protein ligase A